MPPKTFGSVGLAFSTHRDSLQIDAHGPYLDSMCLFIGGWLVVWATISELYFQWKYKTQKKMRVQQPFQALSVLQLDSSILPVQNFLHLRQLYVGRFGSGVLI